MLDNLMGYILPVIVVGGAVWAVINSFKGKNKNDGNRDTKDIKKGE